MSVEPVREREDREEVGLVPFEHGDQAGWALLAHVPCELGARHPVDRESVLVERQERRAGSSSTSAFTPRTEALEPVGPRVEEGDPEHRALLDVGGELADPA